MSKPADGSPTPAGLTRRRLLHDAAVAGTGLLCGAGALLNAACTKQDAQSDTKPANARRARAYRGVNYDVGTGYGADADVRVWHAGSMLRDIRAIRNDMHCDSIGIHGTEIARLVETSVAALQSGLHVWLQPRLFEVSPDDMLSYLSDAAGEAERLRQQYSNVVLNVGCEISLLNSGFAPGATVFERISSFQARTVDWPALHRKLGEVLGKVCTLSRAKFKGPLTYGAGPWEWPHIDWSAFDFVGLDHYMNEENEASYAEPLRRMRRFGKPVVVLEFGCCTYEGAEKAGGMGWDIMDHTSAEPAFKGAPPVRSEQVQAQYIARVLDILAAEKVDGAFVYQFVTPDATHSPDPARDFDMASYGVVKVVSYDPASGAYEWEPKLAFHELASRYGAS